MAAAGAAGTSYPVEGVVRPRPSRPFALAGELASIRTVPTKSGKTEWLERSPEMHVFLPALAVAVYFAEISVAQEGGRLVPIA